MVALIIQRATDMTVGVLFSSGTVS